MQQDYRNLYELEKQLSQKFDGNSPDRDPSSSPFHELHVPDDVIVICGLRWEISGEAEDFMRWYSMFLQNLSDICYLKFYWYSFLKLKWYLFYNNNNSIISFHSLQ